MKYKWYQKVIRSPTDAHEMTKCFHDHKPQIGAHDTETTGLHIIMDRPFLVQFGWLDQTTQEGWAYLVDLERTPKLAKQVITAWLKRAATLEILLGHNHKFDLHMLKNIGFDYETENMSDTMFYIRYAHDAVATKNGGAPLKLKDYAARFVDPTAKHHEAALDSEKTAIAARLNKELLKTFLKGRLMKDIRPFFKDIMNDPEDLPLKDYEAYLAWLDWLPDWATNRFDNLLEAEDIPYNILNRENVYRYALMDIVLTLEVWLVTAPVLQFRENQYALQTENNLILPLLDMERVGFKIDMDYLQKSRLILKGYIHAKRQHFHELAGSDISIGQHTQIKDILQKRFGVVCTSTEAAEISRLASDLRHTGENPSAVDFIDTLQELRTLEKWYSTYLLRFLRNLKATDRLYTTINQVGAVSGRVTSDFQQFPRGGISSQDGQELFNPRRMVMTSGGDYNALIYIDYSQIELRLQAIYTILVEHPEPNLLRAYMPYLCHRSDGTAFDYKNPEHLMDWQGLWFLDETPETVWSPTDVHASTTCYAFNVTPDDPNFKAWRSKGKTLNFAKNYGATIKRIREMYPEASEEEVRRINDAYYKAFPGIRYYHEYCYQLATQQPWAMNLFGTKYYGVSGHNLINMLVQGSGAFFLKEKIRQLWKYAKDNQIKSRMQMNIHDEISWEKHKDESFQIFLDFKRIMEDWADTLVPIVAEMEVSRTTWYEKKALAKE